MPYRRLLYETDQQTPTASDVASATAKRCGEPQAPDAWEDQQSYILGMVYIACISWTAIIVCATLSRTKKTGDCTLIVCETQICQLWIAQPLANAWRAERKRARLFDSSICLRYNNPRQAARPRIASTHIALESSYDHRARSQLDNLLRQIFHPSPSYIPNN